MKTKATVEDLKSLVDTLESQKIKYVVIAGFGLDRRRGYQTRQHQDIDILCLKDDEDRTVKLVEGMGYRETGWQGNLHKLRKADGTKLDLCFLEQEGEELVTYGNRETRFPGELFDQAQRGSIDGIGFNIAPDELLKTWGLDSRKGDDAEYAERIPVDYRLWDRILRTQRTDI